MSTPALPARPASPGAWALLLAAALVVCVWVALSPPSANDLVAGDEGYYGVMARNLIASPAQWAWPSLSPLGPPGDKPPGEPALIALAIGVLGPTATAVRVPSLLAAVLTLFASALLARRLAGAWAAWFTLALLGTLPWYADGARRAAAELPLTAFGLLALVVFTAEQPRRGRAFVAGVLFGAGFLCKLWLVGLLVAPALLLLPRGRAGRTLAALAAGFALPLGAHLALTAAAGPGALAHWAQVTLGFSLASRMGGTGYAAYWLGGPLYYARILGHAFVLVLPLLAIGLVRAAATARRPAARALLAAVAGVALLSVFRIKMGGYLHPLVPQFAILAAFGFEWLRARARTLAFALAVLALAGGSARTAQRLPPRFHDTGFREVCAAVEPVLAGTPREAEVILAPEWPVFAFHTFRRGAYWRSPYVAWTPARFAAMTRGPEPRVFVVDTSRTQYGGWPDDSTLAWLVAHTQERTAAIPGARRGTLRVFVRP